MLSFRMDETNFSQGELDGIRIVTDAGLKVDFDEFTSDGNTLGLWHLHDGACQDEGTGLEDASGGNDLTNYGAVVCEDGYAFDGAHMSTLSQTNRHGQCSLSNVGSRTGAWHLMPTGLLRPSTMPPPTRGS